MIKYLNPLHYQEPNFYNELASSFCLHQNHLYLYVKALIRILNGLIWL